jgi:hypothetical protein
VPKLNLGYTEIVYQNLMSWLNYLVYDRPINEIFCFSAEEQHLVDSRDYWFTKNKSQQDKFLQNTRPMRYKDKFSNVFLTMVKNGFDNYPCYYKIHDNEFTQVAMDMYCDEIEPNEDHENIAHNCDSDALEVITLHFMKLHAGNLKVIVHNKGICYDFLQKCFDDGNIEIHDDHTAMLANIKNHIVIDKGKDHFMWALLHKIRNKKPITGTYVVTDETSDEKNIIIIMIKDLINNQVQQTAYDWYIRSLKNMKKNIRWNVRIWDTMGGMFYDNRTKSLENFCNIIEYNTKIAQNDLSSCGVYAIAIASLIQEENWDTISVHNSNFNIEKYKKEFLSFVDKCDLSYTDENNAHHKFDVNDWLRTEQIKNILACKFVTNCEVFAWDYFLHYLATCKNEDQKFTLAIVNTDISLEKGTHWIVIAANPATND